MLSHMYMYVTVIYTHVCHPNSFAVSQLSIWLNDGIRNRGILSLLYRFLIRCKRKFIMPVHVYYRVSRLLYFYTKSYALPQELCHTYYRIYLQSVESKFLLLSACNLLPNYNSYKKWLWSERFAGSFSSRLGAVSADFTNNSFSFGFTNESPLITEPLGIKSS